MPELETEEDFRRHTEPFRRELQAHCYRMLGSLHDAEDLAQETLLRAWNRRQGFEGRASLRTWLYKIATNACLDALDKRPARTLPPEAGPASERGQMPSPPVADPIWLTPAPEEFLVASTPGPEARYTAREGVALAFLASLQALPPKQRAVLVLRDVLGWQASEVAELLELTVVSVNSALQRARATLDARQKRGEVSVIAPTDEPTRSLLQRYIHAWEEGDSSTLVALLREDATLAMPPMPTWYQGREAVGAFISGVLLAGDARGRYRLRLTAANGQHALAFYQVDPGTRTYRALSLQLLELDGEQIASLTSFLDPSLFPRFGLPDTLTG